MGCIHLVNVLIQVVHNLRKLTLEHKDAAYLRVQHVMGLCKPLLLLWLQLQLQLLCVLLCRRLAADRLRCSIAWHSMIQPVEPWPNLARIHLRQTMR